jgi:hypothetical protein
MKKLLTYFIILVVITGCDYEEDEINIVGKWDVIVYSDGTHSKEVWEFKDKGLFEGFRLREINSISQLELIIKGSWSSNGNEVDLYIEEELERGKLIKSETVELVKFSVSEEDSFIVVDVIKPREYLEVPVMKFKLKSLK